MWLAHLREGTILYSMFLKYLRDDLKCGNLTPEDIGTNEKELEKILVDGCKRDAMTSLEALRKGTHQYAMCLHFLRTDLERGNLTLKSIGTDEDELEKLRVKGCRMAALVWLGHLRSSHLKHNKEYNFFMREELRKSGLTLTDINMNEEQVAALLA